jgi:guanyl-specific ribonuclease Sa
VWNDPPKVFSPWSAYKPTVRHETTCNAYDRRGTCVAHLTPQQRDQAQDIGAVIAGIGVGLGVTALVLAAAACTAVTFGVCGVAAGAAVFALAAGGAAMAATTYSLSTGPKTAEGWTAAAATGAVTGVAGGVVSSAVAKAVTAGIASAATRTAGTTATRTATTAATQGSVAGVASAPTSKVWAVLDRVESSGAPLPGYKGGRVFENREGQLPQVPGVTYREWDVDPYVKGVNRGLERLVTGSDGSAYWTGDHYQSFVILRGAVE